MKEDIAPWSKGIWYIEGLIICILFFAISLFGVTTFILMAISVIIVGIASICLKISENKKHDVKPVLNLSSSISQQLITNTNDLPGEKKYIRSKSLKLQNKLINNITDIQALDKIWRLRKLDLSHNQLTCMKGIEYLPNLRVLKLSDNKIQKIEFIKYFHRLKKLSLDNNQLKELNSEDLPNSLRYINIAKNPIEKFSIYTKPMYKKIHFGSKKWFPKQEIKRLKKQIRHITYNEMKAEFKKIFGIFMLWVGITFGIALLINLMIWGVLYNYEAVPFNFWALFNSGEYVVGLFFAAGILSTIGTALLYYEFRG